MSRRIQFFLVLAVAFLLPIVGSVRVYLGLRVLHPKSQRSLFATVLYQLVGLLCLYVVLKYQSRTFKDIGFSFPMRIGEVWHSFALFVGAFPLGFVVLFLVFIVYPPLRHQTHRTFDDADLFGSQITVWSVLFVCLNPFHEELIVRSFLITEMEYFYRSTVFAVLVSVTIQSSYHLYQGLSATLLHASTFLLFSIYYVRTRRILPVILAHLYLDVSALALYARHLTKH